VLKRAGNWIEAPPLPAPFVVNIGDCLMRWTNDVYVYVSAPHRVINRGGRERYSIAFFYDANPDAEGRGDPRLRQPGRKRPLPPLLAADDAKFRLDASKPRVRAWAPPLA
jgi:isopenicillin N synthase-like dioxygenase